MFLGVRAYIGMWSTFSAYTCKELFPCSYKLPIAPYRGVGLLHQNTQLDKRRNYTSNEVTMKPIQWGVYLQVSSSLISPCSMTQVSGVFSNRALLPSSGFLLSYKVSSFALVIIKNIPLSLGKSTP